VAYILTTDCINIPLCNHYGILFRENGIDYVLHNTPSKFNNVKGNVIIETYSEFMQNRILLKREFVNLTIPQIKEYAYRNMSKKWDSVEYNCETLKNEIITGNKGSTVMTRVIGISALTLFLLYLNQ
jgi:hypothetical protein